MDTAGDDVAVPDRVAGIVEGQPFQVETAGDLWVTGYSQSDIVRMRPDGTLLEPLATPAGGITQVRFGGPDMRDLVLCSVAADAGDTLAVGIMPSEPGSFIYRGRSEVPGLPLAPGRFKLT